jgi:hypothetical protein
MYPLRMHPLMIELCKFHEMLWRKDHPEHDSDFYAVEIAKAFLQSAAERGLARLVKDAKDDLIWEATPRIFRDLDLRALQLPRPPQDDEGPEYCPGADKRTVQITISEELIRDLDWMTAELLDYADDMERAIGVFHGLRQRAFDLLDAIGEGPFKGLQLKQAETPARDISQPPPNG